MFMYGLVVCMFCVVLMYVCFVWSRCRYVLYGPFVCMVMYGPVVFYMFLHSLAYQNVCARESLAMQTSQLYFHLVPYL